VRILYERARPAVCNNQRAKNRMVSKGTARAQKQFSFIARAGTLDVPILTNDARVAPQSLYRIDQRGLSKTLKSLVVPRQGTTWRTERNAGRPPLLPVLAGFEVSDTEQGKCPQIDGDTMPESQPAIPTKYPIVRPPCPKCGNDVIITRIESDKPRYDLRTFECTRCGQNGLNSYDRPPSWRPRHNVSTCSIAKRA
jgi:predicted RNA-binding Zn-ribbon protein involved in translation (DUF1610 family)